MSTHTPGPWKTSRFGDHEYMDVQTMSLNGDGDYIAQVYKDDDAALIAKAPIAPKLAEALHALVNAIYREYPEKVPLYCRTEVESAMDRLTEWDAQ